MILSIRYLGEFAFSRGENFLIERISLLLFSNTCRRSAHIAIWANADFSFKFPADFLYEWFNRIGRDEIDSAASETSAGHSRPENAVATRSDLDEQVQFATAHLVIVS